MAVCLEYQAVYYPNERLAGSWSGTLVAALILLAALSFRVWVKLEIIEAGYQLAEQRQLAVDYDMERRELELQRSVFIRPDQLAKAAESRLGLTSAGPGQLRRIRY